MSSETIGSLDDLRRQRERIMELAFQYRARKIAVFGSLAARGSPCQKRY